MTDVQMILEREISETEEKLSEKNFNLTNIEKASLAFYYMKLKGIREELECTQ